MAFFFGILEAGLRVQYRSNALVAKSDNDVLILQFSLYLKITRFPITYKFGKVWVCLE